MKSTSLIAGMAIAGLMTIGNASISPLIPSNLASTSLGTAIVNSALAEAAEEPTAQQKVEMITNNKGQIGSGDQLRRFFFGHLEPIGVQPGGAGMVVNLYNAENDVTFSYCASYDVVVAVKQGKVKAFPSNEVK